MIGEVIQEYLVALGAKIDKPGFREMDQTIQQSGELITRATGSWAANFVKASTIIASAIAGVKAATLGLMTAAAKQDLEMEKYARSMMMSRDAAEQMKRATDALGESINDITLSPELSERFRELSADGGQMLVGGDFKETMRNFRDLIFQWTRLKQEASYAMTWIGYYLAKYLQKPLAEIRERFREFNDNFVKNISTWTEKAARAIVYILEIGRHFLTFLWDVGKALYNIWDSFPKGVKIATAALAAFWAIMRMSPLGRMITLVSALMLLIDDYYGYMEGKNAALEPLWDKLNEAIERGKELWAEALPVLEDFSNKVEQIVKDFWEWLVELSQDEDVKEFLESVKDLGKAVFDLGIEIFKFIYGALAALFEGFDQTDGIHTFKEALRGVLRVSTVLNKWMTILTDSIKKVFSTVRESHAFKQFWEQQGKSVEAFIRIIEKALKATGKLGEALIALKDGEFSKAWDLAKQGWNELKAGAASVPDALNGGFIGSAVQAGFNFGKNLVNGDREQFFNAVREQESGNDYTLGANGDGARGAYQILEDNWSQWAVDAGLSPDAPWTKENQDIVAQNKLNALINDYGMEGALVAWYSGSQNGERWANGKSTWIDANGKEHAWEESLSNGPSVLDYVRQTMSRMCGGGGGGSFDSSFMSGINPFYIGREDMRSSLEDVWWFNQLDPWIGGVLKAFGAEDATYTSGARSLEHQMEINPDAPDSYHVHGDAVDIALPDGVDIEAIKSFFSQYFDEVLFHSVASAGGGAHLHLGGYLGNGGFDMANTVEETSSSAGGGWRDTVNRMQSAFAANGFMRGGATPPYMNNVGNTATVTIGDINVTIQGGANASAEELGRAFSDQVSAFFQAYGMALAGNNV